MQFNLSDKSGLLNLVPLVIFDHVWFTKQQSSVWHGMEADAFSSSTEKKIH